MSDSVASRYADAVARIQARRRMRLSGLPLSSNEANKEVIENHKLKILESSKNVNRSGIQMSSNSRSLHDAGPKSAAKGGSSSDSLRKCPVEFPPSTHFYLVDVQLMETIKEHQKSI